MRLSSPAPDCSTMRQRLGSRRALFPADFHLPARSPSSSKPQRPAPDSVYDAWLKSREMPQQKGSYLVPGAPRPLTLDNARLALYISQTCIFDLVCRPVTPLLLSCSETFFSSSKLYGVYILSAQH